MKQKQRVTKGVIIVAGLGTRFLPATKAMPKEMLPVLDKPVVQYIVEEMAASGVTSIIFVTNWQKRAIEDHFDRDTDFERHLAEKGKLNILKPLIELTKKVRFFYTRQYEPLGNGHALLCAREFLGDDPFVFSDGDSIIDAETPVVRQLVDVFGKVDGSVIGVQKISDPRQMTKYGNIYGTPEHVSAAARKHESTKARERKNTENTENKKTPARNAAPASNASRSDAGWHSIAGGQKTHVNQRLYRVDKFVEKPDVEHVSPHGLIAGGMRYVFTPDIWPALEQQPVGRDGEIWLADAANTLAKEKPFYAYEYEGKYFDTGDKISLLKAALHFAEKEGLM